MSLSTGISALGLAVPSLALPVESLAALRGVDPAKYTVGLGCETIALCAPGESAVTLATTAARRALARWGGDPSRIGLLAVGTESAPDMSRPMSAFVAEALGLSGAMRSYEVKHACYGGTVALRQALEWRLSGAARGRAALVVASDVALYRLEDGGEPTQGAGAVAFVVDTPDVALVDVGTASYAEPAFDFHRPVGHAFPVVDGKLSLDCYVRAATRCFEAYARDPDAPFAVEAARYACFHVPFPKMVRKAVPPALAALGWDEPRIEAFFTRAVEPTLALPRRIGNAYTASTWFSVASVLPSLTPAEPMLAFSYGSGFGSELLALRAGPKASDGGALTELEADFAARRVVSGAEYLELRRAHVGVV